MVARIKTVSFRGVDVLDIDVEVQISGGFVAFTIVGLPDKAVAESRERVRASLHAMGLALPAKRITINLAPADVAKEGSHYDLPIALGLLTAMDVIPSDALGNYIALGELGLDASLRSVTGVLPAAVHAQKNNMDLVCPAASGPEAAWAGDLDILAPNSLLQLINHFKGVQVINRPSAVLPPETVKAHRDLSEVKGQETAKRALEITAAGGHNLLMVGPPGSGKSMLASCLPGLLPKLSPIEALEVSIIHSLAGTLPEGGLVRTRPYRDPHHTASQPALIGGGQKAKPGEISLAHNGVLFLDELPEFQRATLESLRQPMETGETLVARVNYHISYPADFQLVAAMNPCRCGYFGSGDENCAKAPRCAEDYQSKISGPLLDRIDLQVDVQSVPVTELAHAPNGEASENVAARVERARARQKNRFEAMGSSLRINSQASGEALEKIAALHPDAKSMLEKAAVKMKFSARSWHRLLRVSRTIADLEGDSPVIEPRHMAEALSFRRLRLQDL